MNTTKTGIGLLIIAIAVIILIFTFRKFVFPALGEFAVASGDALNTVGKGFTDFFNSFENESQVKKDEREAQDIFNKQVEQKEQDAKNAGFTNVLDYERATDTNQDPLKFNPSGTIGYGYPELNSGRGIPDTPENRIILDKFIKDRQAFGSQGEVKLNDAKTEFVSYDFFGVPNAYAEEYPQYQEPIYVKPASVDINKQVVDLLNPSTKTKPQEKIVESKPQGTTTIQGVVRNNVGTEQQFQVFSSDSSRPVFGTINPTPQDPRKLKTDSKKVPIETASERANRVFIETGDFADVNRGASSTKITGAFNFGSNTGSGSKLPTVNKGGTTGSAEGNKIVEERIAQLKKIQEQRALAVFNSGAIQKF